MKLLCCVVTCNRLEYTKRTIASWSATAREDDHLMIVDNASTDGTREWLFEDATILLEKNLFPGAATNIGWHEGLKEFDADLLMRSDNDIEYLPGWREEVEQAFTADPKLGQLGVLNRHEDYDNKQPVTEKNGANVRWGQTGGNCVIRRELYDKGLRWTPGAWRPGGRDEDAVLSAEIKSLGWTVAEVIPTVANNMAFGRFTDYEDYYRLTAGLRGLVPELSV